MILQKKEKRNNQLLLMVNDSSLKILDDLKAEYGLSRSDIIEQSLKLLVEEQQSINNLERHKSNGLRRSKK